MWKCERIVSNWKRKERRRKKRVTLDWHIWINRDWIKRRRRKSICVESNKKKKIKEKRRERKREFCFCLWKQKFKIELKNKKVRERKRKKIENWNFWQKKMEKRETNIKGIWLVAKNMLPKGRAKWVSSEVKRVEPKQKQNEYFCFNQKKM